MNTNYLIHSHSPYLLQHASNPVDWRPWGEEAFRVARETDKPIFLSIGYATCHWCHVMAHESFEDIGIAEKLNDVFVCVKVDREERPDIDALYMAACQLITGSGGWPLSVFLTHELLPFFAATYIPKTTRFGRLGIVDLSNQIDRLWKQKRSRLMTAASQMKSHLEPLFAMPQPEAFSGSLAHQAADQLLQRFDPVHGGFEPAPKFPTPHRISFLLQQQNRKDSILPAVDKTLRAMRHGGIWDHVGFGFHRYATDNQWLVPHFEKMLTDQAWIAMAYLQAHLHTKDPFFAQTAKDILTYVLRDLRSPEGPFFSAEDADSEGEEGRFYTWSLAEFQRTLGSDADKWAVIFDVRAEGNYLEEATGTPTGTNILYLRRPLEQWARQYGQSAADMLAEWEGLRSRLYEARSTRIRPLRDEKILLDWNGMMIQALAMAARVLQEETYARCASTAAAWIEQNMRDESGLLVHRWFQGNRGIPAMGNDYAQWIAALLGLYRATGNSDSLAKALHHTRLMEDRFRSGPTELFHTVGKDHLELPIRPLSAEDGAIPSIQSTMLNNFVTLYQLTEDPEWKQKAKTLADALAPTMRRYPLSALYGLEAMGRLEAGWQG